MKKKIDNSFPIPEQVYVVATSGVNPYLIPLTDEQRLEQLKKINSHIDDFLTKKVDHIAMIFDPFKGCIVDAETRKPI